VNIRPDVGVAFPDALRRGLRIGREPAHPRGSSEQGLMRLISWIVALVVGIAIVLFAISNREIVQIGFWPLEGSIALPLFVPVLVAGFVTFILGGIVTWLSAAPARRLSRRRQRRIEDLELRLARLEERER